MEANLLHDGSVPASNHSEVILVDIPMDEDSIPLDLNNNRSESGPNFPGSLRDQHFVDHNSDFSSRSSNVVLLTRLESTKVIRWVNF